MLCVVLRIKSTTPSKFPIPITLFDPARTQPALQGDHTQDRTGNRLPRDGIAFLCRKSDVSV
eukprot:284012-Pyramimonas_sp.AAC.1